MNWKTALPITKSLWVMGNMGREPDDAYYGFATDETDDIGYCSHGERKESVDE